MQPQKKESLKSKIHQAIINANKQGRIIEEEYLEKNFNILKVDEGENLVGVLKDLQDQGTLFKFTYIDKVFYICREQNTIHSVLHGWIEEEYKKLRRSAEASSDSIAKQRLVFQRSILKDISKTLQDSLEQLKSDTGDIALREDVKTSVTPILKEKITKGTQRFFSEFRVEELYSTELLKDSPFLNDDFSYFDLLSCIGFMVHANEVLEIEISKEDKLYLDKSLLDKRPSLLYSGRSTFPKNRQIRR